jgi:putative transcriptional regulator
MKSGFLIAAPQMLDPNFERTVILLCQFDNNGALGIVINRSTSVTVGAVTEEVKIAPPRHASDAIWWGGPVSPGTCFVVWRGQVEEDEGWNIGSNIAVSRSLQRLEHLVQLGHHFHLSIGFAGWAPDQLQGEIERGSWLYTDADPALLFETPQEARYDHALALLGLTTSTVLMTPGEA